MRTTDKKGAIIGTVLGIIVLACVLIICALIGTNKHTASAETIGKVQDFTLNYGRINNISPIDKSYQVVITYFDNGEGITNRIQTRTLSWYADSNKFYVNNVEEEFAQSLQWKYIIKVWSNDIENIRLFSQAAAITSDNATLNRDRIGYYSVECRNDVPKNYIAENVIGDYIFLGYTETVANSLKIMNSNVLIPDEERYDVILCTNVKNVTLPAFTQTGDSNTLGTVLKDAKPMYWVRTNYSDGFEEGTQYGIRYANRNVYKNSASYVAGYNAGQQGQYTFLNLMTAVVDAPVKAVAGIFNIEILGYNMQYLITGLLTVSLAMFIVRKIGGGL